jgi:translation initiation factor 1
MSSNSRLVYSTDSALNQKCPRCGQLTMNCTCRPAEAVPANLTVKLRIEKGGRGGKSVTVLYDLPRNSDFVKDLAAKLKKACGTGGTAKEDTVELQGDYRERLRQLLPTMGYKVKG